MRRALLLLFSLITLLAAAQPKFSTQPLPPTTTFKKLPTVGLQQRTITQQEINRLDSINKLFPHATLPLFTGDYLKSGYVQYYTADYEEYDREQGRIYYRIPYEYTQYYTTQKLVSKYEYSFCYDTLKQAWLRQIGNWPYFRRDSIFLSNTAIMIAHSPASYNIDTLRVYNGPTKIFDTKGKYGAWYIPYHKDANMNAFVYTQPELNSFVAKIKVGKKVKKYTNGDDTLGIAKLKKFTAELDTNDVFSTGQEKLHLVKDIFIALDSLYVGEKIKKGTEYYVLLTEGQAFGRTEPMHLVFFALPATKKVRYIKPLKYVKLKASTGRKGEGGAEPKE